MRDELISTALALSFIIFLVGLVGCKKKTESEQAEKTFYDVVKEDDARLRAEPKLKETQPTETARSQGRIQQAQAQPTQQFRQLTEEEDAEAQRLLEWAIQSRKMGRLPVVSYKQTVDSCRAVIKRFPGSEYEFRAKRILADIPEQYRRQYKITDEEIDLGNLE